jgi:DNA modification methylase
MLYIKGNFYEQTFSDIFDGVITDPPYKGVTATNCPVKDRLQETSFCAEAFMKRCDEMTTDNSFLITFCNIQNGMDLREASKKTSWDFFTYQIWDKRPTRSWISWSMPLRHCELIFYFRKGNFKFNFRTGVLKPAVRRSNFGGRLKANASKNTSQVSQEMYSEIVTYRVDHANKKHPTEKPIGFSSMFAKIVGSDKRVIDPFCGTGNLLHSFEDSVGVDVRRWE